MNENHAQSGDSTVLNRWILRCLHPPEVKSLEIDPAAQALVITIGRDQSNSIVLQSERFPGVSAHHARIVVDGLQLVLEDLQSRNGTFVAGKRAARSKLRHGDIFELGANGPRFIVLASNALNETAEMPSDSRSKSVHIGQDTMHAMREEFGIQGEGGVEAMLESSERRGKRSLVLAVAVLAIAVAATAWRFWTRGEKAFESVKADTTDLEHRLQDQLAQARSAVEEQRRLWQQQAADLEAARASWSQQKSLLEVEKQRLVESIGRLETGDQTKSTELAQLRKKLDETSAALEMYNPINLEQARLSTVSKVEHCVVFVEVTQTFREPGTGKELFVVEDPIDGSFLLNLDDLGERMVQESSGSGFCISADGWIVTNAHVVQKKNDAVQIPQIGTLTVEPQVHLEVVFSGNGERHPAELVHWANAGADDLALLKITPYEGMPYLEHFTADLPPPSRGAEVFLLGFPLGKQTLGQGSRLSASAFRGIVSRVFDSYLQVDAAVHPGASGGPLIDNSGTVIGVVVGMQRIDAVAGSSAIGYIIPIRELLRIWPPP